MESIAEMNRQSFENMKKARGLDFLKMQMTVEVNGKRGRVVGNHGHNLLVRYEKYKASYNCHPHWKTKYYNSEGEFIKEYFD